MTDAEVERCLRGSFDMGLPDGERLTHIDCAWFAERNDPSVWLQGWHPALATAQIHALQSVDPGSFEGAGGKPFLLLQGKEDAVAPADAVGQALAQTLGEQVTYVEIAHAGHAMVPERPEEIADCLVEYFSQLAH